uniref:G-protein coupled receptors family 1 profile domain-containing protein n=1 Tax=Timema cristinae TaxID=61476 RepID=A0A7R9D9J5_TIMCR|nr:unnamed protein product [Timema cristinae]
MADNASEVYYPSEVEYDTSEVEYNTSEVEYYPSEVYNASEVEYDISEMKYDTSEMKCYPFLMDEEFIKCAESKLGSSGQTTNETRATSCCLYEFVDRINKSFDKFIADYLRADNVSITCNITQDNLTAPLAFNRTNSCAHEDSSGRVMVFNSTCVQEYLRSEINISSSIYKDCFMELKAGSIQFQYSAAIFILLIIMFGAVLNCSVLIVYCKQRSLWKPLNLYLVSTLLADTLVLIIVAPIHLTELLTEKWKFGDLIYFSSNDEDTAYGKVVRADTSDGPLTSSSTFAIGFGLILVLLLIHFAHSLVMKIRSDTTFYKSASGESDPSESVPPMVLSSPSAPQEEDSSKAEWILPSTRSQGISGGGGSRIVSEDFKDPSEVSKAPSEISKDPSEVPQESPPTYRDSVAESSKPQNQSFELTTSL